jgi:AcrR family transcriptional regulator
MGPRARTTEDKLQKRRTILEAAKKLFFERGYQNATIEMITELAGLSTGTFYLYFKSKREIYMTLYADGIDIFHRMAERAISWPGMSTIGRLSAIADAYHRFYTEYKEYFDILAFIHLHQEELKNPGDIKSELDEKALKLLQMIESVIRKGVESGELAPMDTWKATNVLWGMMDGLVMLAERQNVTVIGVSLEELIKQALEIIFYGMVKRDVFAQEPRIMKGDAQ